MSSDYSLLERFLHNLALASKFVPELSFNLESNTFKKIPPRLDAVYVTGLARAGTTTLMRGLYDTKQFASLTYDDMPFVLAPNLWGAISKYKKKRLLKERAHKDGVMIDFDSPEALEEVFWKMQSSLSYVSKEMLNVDSIDQDTICELKNYQSLICHKYHKNRYLAKNNNLILRLNDLAKLSRDMAFLIIFRNPIDQASSLLNQHQKFLNSDKFTQQYMTWLGHHDFGSTHRPYNLNNKLKINYDSNCIDYWLERWIDFYSYTITLYKDNGINITLLCYEDICNNSYSWRRLCNKLMLPESTNPFLKKNFATSLPQSRLIREANNLYEKLREYSLI